MSEERRYEITDGTPPSPGTPERASGTGAMTPEDRDAEIINKLDQILAALTNKED